MPRPKPLSYGAVLLQRQYQSQYDNIMKQLKPTFGLSFGLPHQGGGGYPFSPHGVYPHHGTIDGTGINLGLVSVNPLVSVQFTKDDYGNKVIKPFVNLHLTPNHYLVNKFEDLISYKKGVILNKHKHYHVHKGYPNYGPPHGGYYEGPYREHPEEFHHGGQAPDGYLHHPEIYDGPPGPEYHHGPPPFAHHPEHFEGPPSGYFDDPQNYGGGPYGHHDTFLGRAYNNVSYTSGLSLEDQYQNKYNEGVDSYGNPLGVAQFASNSIEKTGLESRYPPVGFRGGKSLSVGGERGKISFPSSRRRRDLTHKDQTTNDIKEGRTNTDKVKNGDT